MSDGYQLVQLRNGSWSVRALTVGETFHPVVGPAHEAESLYVRQLRLPERFAELTNTSPSKPLVMWDIGLGAAANVLVALHSLASIRGHIQVLSFDQTLEPLRFALTQTDRLGYFGGLDAEARHLVNTGTAEFQNGASSVSWKVLTGDFPSLIQSTGAGLWPKPHAILFDAYSPARNPAMWTLPLFARLRELATPETPCALATYSRATLLRVTLLLAGWFVGIGQSTGEKDETTLAANCKALIDQPLPPQWLDRAFRSSSAEPLVRPEYRQDPLSDVSRRALSSHPQFPPDAAGPEIRRIPGS